MQARAFTKNLCKEEWFVEARQPFCWKEALESKTGVNVENMKLGDGHSQNVSFRCF